MLVPCINHWAERCNAFGVERLLGLNHTVPTPHAFGIGRHCVHRQPPGHSCWLAAPSAAALVEEIEHQKHDNDDHTAHGENPRGLRVPLQVRLDTGSTQTSVQCKSQCV